MTKINEELIESLKKLETGAAEPLHSHKGRLETLTERIEELESKRGGPGKLDAAETRESREHKKPLRELASHAS